MAGTPFHNQVAMDKIPQDAWSFTVALASTITEDDIGKAVQLDSTANKFKLAADGGNVHGILRAVETDADGDGTGYGTITLKFIEALPLKSGDTIAVGDTVVGAGSGEVKRLSNAGNSAPDHSLNMVVEVRSGFVVVYKP